MNADAEIAELELARIRQTLCKTDDVVKAWESVLHACRSKFMAVPSKMAPVLANITDTAVIKDHLESAVREALEELANYQATIDPVATGSSVRDGDDTEKPKRKVGRPRKTQAIQ